MSTETLHTTHLSALEMLELQIYGSILEIHADQIGKWIVFLESHNACQRYIDNVYELAHDIQDELDLLDEVGITFNEE